MSWHQPWYTDLDAAEASATFPTAVLSVRDYYDRNIGGGTINGSFTVPAGSPYAVKLPVPLSRAGYAVTVGGVARTLVSGTPSSGQVKLDRMSGVLTFHSSDAGGAATWVMTPYVTAITGQDLAWLQGEILAAQNAILTGRGQLTSGIDLKTVANTTILASGAADREIIRVSLRITAATSATVAPTVGLGVSGSATVSDAVLLAGMTTTGAGAWVFTLGPGRVPVLAAGTALQLIVSGGATATTLTGAVRVWAE